MVDGRLAGGWRREAKGRSVTVTPTLLRPLTDPERAAMAEHVERYARFLDARVTVAGASTS